MEKLLTEYFELSSKTHKGKVISEEQKLIISKKLKGRKVSEETRNKNRQAACKTITVYESGDKITHICTTGFKVFCEENNLPFYPLERTMVSGNRQVLLQNSMNI